MNLKSLRYLLVIILVLSTLILINSGTADAINCYVRTSSCSPSSACSQGDINTNQCKPYDIGNVAPSLCAVGTGSTSVCVRGCCCDVAGNSRVTTQGLCITPSPDRNFGSGIINAADCSNYCSASPTAQWNITGTIKGSDGNPIANAQVALNSMTAVTDGSGNYRFNYINSGGPYTITATWQSTCSNFVSNIFLTANAVENINIPCGYYNVTGFVRDASSNPINKADVKTTANGVTYVAHSGSNGKYTLIGILQGSLLTITANATVSANGCQGSVDISNPIKTNLTDKNGTNITVSCQWWTLSGTVYNGADKVVNAKVDTNRGISAFTDGNGLYSLLLPQGSVTVTASTSPANVAGATRTCTNSTTTNLLLSTNGADIYLSCCDTTCYDSQCVNGLITTTCTQAPVGTAGSCPNPTPTPTTRPCNALPPCQWNCTAWSTCNAGDTQQTRSCLNKFTDNCDATIPVNQPPLIQACPTSCGNGVLDAGEQCDYNPYTAIFNAADSCINLYKTASGDPNWGLVNMTTNSCYLDTCQCRPPPNETKIP